MKLLVVIFFLLPSVFSLHHLRTGLDLTAYQQLRELQNLTDILEREGNYTILQQMNLKVKLDELSLHIFTRSDPNGTQISFPNVSHITEVSAFNTNHRTIIYIHGWNSNVTGNNSVSLRNSVLNVTDANVILLDWDKCAKNIYFVGWDCVEGVGHYLGEHLLTLSETYKYSLDNVVIVGHSLGAHIAGYAGKYTISTKNTTLSVIVGLDPAGPLFFKNLENHRLTENDAHYVQAIHTSINFLGINLNSGHADFWPNGGHSQPGCGIDLTGECSHSRAILYYIESVRANAFVSRQCDTYNSFENGKCDRNPKNKMGGLDLDTTAKGDYFLSTNEKSPFGKGDL